VLYKPSADSFAVGRRQKGEIEGEGRENGRERERERERERKRKREIRKEIYIERDGEKAWENRQWEK
jgi:hypothetical protein